VVFIIIGIISLVLCVIAALFSGDNWKEKIGMSVMMSLVSLLVSLFIALIISMILDVFTDKVFELKSTNEIVALQDKNSVIGHFFLGSGSIDGDMKYVFMSKEQNGFRMESFDANEAIVVYSDDKKIERYESEFKNQTLKKLFGQPWFADSEYKIYVPDGTIQNSYNVDLK